MQHTIKRSILFLASSNLPLHYLSISVYLIMRVLFPCMFEKCTMLWVCLVSWMVCDFVLAQEPEELPGGPGEPTVLDQYNTEISRWRHDYGPTEPQQIHLTMVSDGLAYRVQFSTRAPLHAAVFQYWPAADKNPTVSSVWNLEEVSDCTHPCDASCSWRVTTLLYRHGSLLMADQSTGVSICTFS